jgi:uncharacterized membrane protein YfcA
LDYEISALMALLLVGTGTAAGFINVLAGGGSFLTIPALMLLGIPADIANATNRVGVMMQAVEGVRGFNRHGMLPREAVGSIMLPTLVGSLLGALTASYMPLALLEPILLVTLIGMAVLMVARPALMTPAAGTEPLSPRHSRAGFIGLLLAGVYGGFIQAGVGFVLLAALAGALRYDLVRANALKMVATALFTGVALVIFIARDQILWAPGLLLAVGAVLGARLSVNVAMTVNQTLLRWFLLVTVVAVCLAVWLT